MANPFYVQPSTPDARPLLAGIGGLIKENRLEREDERQKQEVIDVMNRGNQAEIANILIKYPKRSKEIKDAYGFRSKETEQMVSDAYQRAITDPENAKEHLTGTMERLTEMGVSTDNMFEDLGELERNPEAGIENLSATYAAINPKGWKAMQGAGGTDKFKSSVFAPITLVNPNTKEKILVSPIADPNTGKATLSRYDIPKGFEISRETTEEKRAGDIISKREEAKAAKLGAAAAASAGKAIDQPNKMRANNQTLRTVIDTVRAGGASGPLISKLPSFRAESVRLDNLQKQLGLDVIGSVTFGALSQGELDLALSKALPTALDGPELIKWADDKIAAQEKLADYLEEQAIFLSKENNTEADWAELQKTKQRPQDQNINDLVNKYAK